MSPSPDNFNGNETSSLFDNSTTQRLLDYEGDPIVEEAGTPGHRKTQSLFGTAAERAKKRNNARHHRHRSSIGELLESINEGVQAEAVAVKGVWEQELGYGDRGRRFFLDMSMTRSLSVLPEEIAEFAEEAVGHKRRQSSVLFEEHLDLAPPIPRTPTASFSSYAALLTAVFAVSSNGTALAMLHGVEPVLKLFWRMTAVALVLMFFAVKTMVNQYRENKKFLPQLTASQWLLFASAALCFFLHTLLMFTALSLTSIGNAVIGANSQSLILILGKFLTGQKVVWMEALGVFVAFAGCALCVGDEAAGEEPGEKGGTTALLGDLLAFLSAVAGVGYLTFAKAVRPHMSVTVFMFLVMLSGCCFCLIYMAAMRISCTFSNDPHVGLFGWMSSVDHHIFILLYIAVVCNVVGTMGFVRAMEYFENIIIAVATLLEPMIATLIAFALGVGHLPGPMGWAGNVLVALGTFGVVYPSMKDGNSSGGH